MHIHHLDCATMCPLGGARMGQVDTMVGHCLLVEAADGLVLVDTGFGTSDNQRLPWYFTITARPVLEGGRTALAQVRERGFQPSDVRHIVVTHLDLDHAGGLSDFPDATVHVRAEELARATRRGWLKDRLRYLSSQWAHGPRWSTTGAGGDRWNGLEAVRGDGLPDGVLLVPLPGHTGGHQGVAVRGDGGWVLHVGDLWPHRGHLTGAPIPWGLRLYERILADDLAVLRANQDRVRELATSATDVRVICAHDADDLSEARSASVVRGG